MTKRADFPALFPRPRTPSMANIRSIPDHLRIALLLINREQNIHYVNPSFENLIGNSLKQIDRHNIAQVIEHPNGWETLISEITPGNTLVERNTTLILPHLRKKINADIAIGLIAGGDFLVEIEPLDLANVIVRTADRVQQAEHNRLLIRNLAHEIRNPLAGIKGAAQRLRDVDKERQSVYLKLIIAQVERLNRLLEQMAGEGRPSLRPSNIHRLLEESIALIEQDTAYENITFRRDYDPSLPDLAIDPGQIQQVLHNLISNAAKAQCYRGEIAIATGITYPAPGPGKQRKSALCVTIIDHGCGIPETLQSAIFQPMIGHFEHGSGLGLAIAQDIVHRHGGSIDLQSSSGETAFSVFLPLPRRKA